jgi:hypothetical protein
MVEKNNPHPTKQAGEQEQEEERKKSGIYKTTG